MDRSTVRNNPALLDRVAIAGGASIYPFCWNVLLSARAHGLGVAPDEWGTLRELAGRHGVSLEILMELGLVRSRDGGRPYDFFRGRLMIPIRDLEGRTTGFGARRLGEAPGRRARPRRGAGQPQSPRSGRTGAVHIWPGHRPGCRHPACSSLAPVTGNGVSG